MSSRISSGPSVSTPSRPVDAAHAWAALPAEYAIPERPVSLAEARNYCARLARSHYENFFVASWLLPRRLRQHFFNIYAYCRIADDMADQVGDPDQSLYLLDEWEAELQACFRDEARHPVFVALRDTVREFNIPLTPFADLLTAFRRDQFVSRYETFEDLLSYCRYSANPVGHLVLYVCGYRDAERRHLADHTCTALQLANFWQGVASDRARGRIYIPLEDLRRFGLKESDLSLSRATPELAEMMRFEVSRARDWFERGLPLADKVDRGLAGEIRLFTRGGLEILNAIERQDFDVLAQRPVISRWRKLILLLRAARETWL